MPLHGARAREAVATDPDEKSFTMSATATPARIVGTYGWPIVSNDWCVTTSIHGDSAMKPINKILAAGLLTGFGIAALPMVASAQVTMAQERAAHPRLVEAIHNLRDVVRELEAAPDDFGGNKGAAIADAKRTIHSIKRALYWRLKMDDAALDRAD
jgi:hypothetical protein